MTGETDHLVQRIRSLWTRLDEEEDPETRDKLTRISRAAQEVQTLAWVKHQLRDEGRDNETVETVLRACEAAQRNHERFPSFGVKTQLYADLYERFDTFEEIRITDAGCGGRADGTVKEPSDARILAYMGATVTGIDQKGPVSNQEPYRHKQRDLLRTPLQDLVQDQEVVLYSSLFTAPSMDRSRTVTHGSTNTNGVREYFLREARNVLRDGGVLAADELRREDSELLRDCGFAPDGPITHGLHIYETT